MTTGLAHISDANVVLQAVVDFELRSRLDSIRGMDPRWILRFMIILPRGSIPPSAPVFKRIDNRPLLLLEFAQPPSCVYSLRWEPTAADGAEQHYRYRRPAHDLGRHSGPQDMAPAALALDP